MTMMLRVERPDKDRFINEFKNRCRVTESVTGILMECEHFKCMIKGKVICFHINHDTIIPEILCSLKNARNLQCSK